MRKATLFLTGMALALVAFAPAAQAKEFYIDPGNLTIGQPTLVTIDGTVTFTFAGGAMKVGPCSVHQDGLVTNEEGQGRGTRTGYSFGDPCGTNLPGCSASQVTETGSETEMVFFGEEESEVVGWEETAIGFDFSAGCAVFGVPAGIELTGTLTGKLGENGCFVWNKSGDLKDAFGNEVTADGEACITHVKNDTPQGKGTITYK